MQGTDRNWLHHRCDISAAMVNGIITNASSQWNSFHRASHKARRKKSRKLMENEIQRYWGFPMNFLKLPPLQTASTEVTNKGLESGEGRV